MKIITISGPPSSGKTATIVKTIECLRNEGKKVGVVKFDCLTSFDNLIYEEYKIPLQIGLSGKICPDHFFISNIEDAREWAEDKNLDFLITESAGLCNRCSPYMKGILAVCIIDNLSGVNTPKKIGPMLKYADIVVVTKGDIVSQAEREVFAFHIREANPGAKIVHVNGITGQGTFMLSKYFLDAKEVDTLQGNRLRFTVPSSVCSYCTGETLIGESYQMGMMRKIQFE
ncbi:GTP-binding protein [Anaerosporobacter sp.]